MLIILVETASVHSKRIRQRFFSPACTPNFHEEITIHNPSQKFYRRNIQVCIGRGTLKNILVKTKKNEALLNQMLNSPEEHARISAQTVKQFWDKNL